MKVKALRRLGSVGLMLLLIVLTGRVARGQNSNTGEIKGTVTDSSGAVIDGVAVTITNVDTGVSIITATNPSGIYDAPSVPTGKYVITFAHAGFRNFVREGVILQVQTIAIDAALQLGVATETINVNAEAPLLQTETS